MRVPRKKKKFYKKLWLKRLGYKVIIIKSSIDKSSSFDGINVVWGCMTRPKNKRL
jgi:hypothetical protein